MKKLAELQGEEIFSKREEKEFLYIFNKLDFSLRVSIPLEEKVKDKDSNHWKIVGHIIADISFIHFLLKLTELGYFYFDNRFPSDLLKGLKVRAYPEILQDREAVDFELPLELTPHLVKFDLVDLNVPDKPFAAVNYIFNSKMNRFRFWVEHKNIKPKFPFLEYKKFIPELKI